MTTSSTTTERKMLIVFIGVTIVLSFGIPFLPQLVPVAPYLMVLIPAILALLLTGITMGGKGVLGLIGKVFDGRVGIKWYIITLGLALSMRLTMSVVAILLGWIPGIQVRAWSPAQFLMLGVILLISASLEGIGWRGYVLPRLMKRNSALISALLIGVFWGALHISLSLPGMIYEGTPWLGTILELVGLSVLITWLYVQTRGNILVTIVLHASQSFFVIVNEGISLVQQVWLMGAVYLTFAIVIVAIFGPDMIRKLSKEPVRLSDVHAP
jgi:membrane protease YdiL (CAAX protease family)